MNSFKRSRSEHRNENTKMTFYFLLYGSKPLPERDKRLEKTRCGGRGLVKPNTVNPLKQ